MKSSKDTSQSNKVYLGINGFLLSVSFYLWQCWNGEELSQPEPLVSREVCLLGPPTYLLCQPCTILLPLLSHWLLPSPPPSMGPPPNLQFPQMSCASQTGDTEVRTHVTVFGGGLEYTILGKAT